MEAHIAGVNEALKVANKAHKKQWQWPFAPDPRQKIICSSNDEDELKSIKTESVEMKTRAKDVLGAQEATQIQSK